MSAGQVALGDWAQVASAGTRLEALRGASTGSRGWAWAAEVTCCHVPSCLEPPEADGSVPRQMTLLLSRWERGGGVGRAGGAGDRAPLPHG